MVIKYNKNQKMETLIILLCISLFIVILRVCREIYYDRSTAINYARTFDANLFDDDDNYRKYVYNSLRVQ